MTALLAGEEQVLHATQHWLDRAVIGLNLCPFAKAVRRKGQIRFVVSPARSRGALLAELAQELLHLHRSDAELIDTTLLIHPRVLTRFADYNDFLDQADALLQHLQLEGRLQIASFHPRYRFAGVSARDPAHLSNRSPYPMLHLLREDSIARAVQGEPEAERIYERNIALLRQMGHEGWQRWMAVPSSPATRQRRPKA